MAEGAIGKLQFRSKNSKAFSVGRPKMTMWNMDLYQFRKVVRLLRRQCFKRDTSNQQTAYEPRKKPLDFGCLTVRVTTHVTLGYRLLLHDAGLSATLDL